ncbi:MAG: hypothetical protein V4494_00550 [Chlamydiota bacterium]
MKLGKDVSSNKLVAEFLKQISSEEKELLEYFFYYLIHDSGGYVLLGSKPMSICSYLDHVVNDTHPIYFMMEAVRLRNIKIKRGFEIWQKYASLFPIKNYLFLSEPNFLTKDIQFIFFINRKNFISKLHEHRREIMKVLGREVTVEGIVEAALAGKALWSDILNGREALLGILLGYGRNNAWNYQKITEIDPIKHKPFIKIRSKPSLGFSSVEEEFEAINDKLDFFSLQDSLSEWNDLLLRLPGFRADLDDPETQELKKAYTKDYHRILRYYKGKDFLEATLEQLIR